MSKALTGSRLGKAHNVLEFEVVIQFRLFRISQSAGLFTLDQHGNALINRLRSTKGNNRAWAWAGGNKVNHFFVTLHHTLEYCPLQFAASAKCLRNAAAFSLSK